MHLAFLQNCLFIQAFLIRVTQNRSPLHGAHSDVEYLSGPRIRFERLLPVINALR